MKSFPFYQQHDSLDCGLACLRMVCASYGKRYTSQQLRSKSLTTRRGLLLSELSEAAEGVGLRTMMARVNPERLINEVPLPAVVHWNESHYVVVYHTSKDSIWVADPSFGKLKYSHKEFERHWLPEDKTPSGVVLMLEPTPQFHSNPDASETKWDMSILLSYLKPYRKLMAQILIGMIAGGILQLFVPLITQALVDKGIGPGNLNFIHLVIIAQVMLLVARMMINLIQNRITVFVNARVSISLLSDFLVKMMKLPMSFFYLRNTGDILQRIRDNETVREFLTGTTVTLLFSVFNFFFFSAILGWYSITLLAIYLIGSAIHATWLLLFLRKRRELNYKMFENGTSNQNVLIQLITAMQEIKLHNVEQQKRWEWERVQTKAYHLSLKSLNLGQSQETGAFFINESKNIILTYITVMSVISGDITLGMMMSAQYIIGSLNGPVSSFISLIQTMQDVKIALERMGEIHHEKEEEDPTNPKLNPAMFEPGALKLRDVTFGYDGELGRKVLNNVTIEIPQNKITAIVGPSGSGKTTFLKLLLRLHEPTSGELLVGDTRIAAFEHKLWRSKCAAVMQDGFIFSDTIAKNIAMSEDENVDYEQLRYSLEVANIKEFVEALPLGINTRIGTEGVGLSQGQRQRILIARAVYRNPDFLFLDEATNALDSRNEKSIMENLDKFFRSRTVVIVAHRLSTVVHSDKILVLENGKISEEGNHTQLVGQRGLYYSLVQNQLFNQ